MVVRHVVARTGIQTAASVFRDEAVELVGNHVVSRFQTQLVDVLLNLSTLSLVFCLRKQVVLHGDAVQPRLFCLIINSSDTIRAFEHDMLEIVGNTCIRTVLRARLHHDGTKHLRLRVVFVQPYGHAVTQFKLLNLQGCTDVACLCKHAGHYSDKKNCFASHNHPCFSFVGAKLQNNARFPCISAIFFVSLHLIRPVLFAYKATPKAQTF